MTVQNSYHPCLNNCHYQHPCQPWPFHDVKMTTKFRLLVLYSALEESHKGLLIFFDDTIFLLLMIFNFIFILNIDMRVFSLDIKYKISYIRVLSTNENVL